MAWAVPLRHALASPFALILSWLSDAFCAATPHTTMSSWIMENWNDRNVQSNPPNNSQVSASSYISDSFEHDPKIRLSPASAVTVRNSCGILWRPVACGPTLGSPPSSWVAAVAAQLQRPSFVQRSGEGKWKLGSTTNWKAGRVRLMPMGRTLGTVLG
jgi:hypothetical protein